MLLILSGAGILTLKAIVTAAPYVAYFVAGILVTLAWQKARACIRGRREGDGEQTEPEPTPDVGEALRRLVADDNGVLLTRVRDDLKLPNTKRVKQLLDEAGVTWKAVRTSRGNGPGVHKNDIPPDPSPVVADAHAAGCCCRSSGNNNSDNGTDPSGREGLHVEPIGLAGSVLRQAADEKRHHQINP
ncbi:hypothetical protein [Streptomyces cadmiisoli]|uniref:hypothetical protein n=1 Tax=Streptomyces cadmiisoli TaxID=2184053 RepID=UPI003D7270FE